MRALEVFFQFLRLGCTSFGGPVAHLAYFRKTFVERERWLDDATFGECVALTQLLPGPGSSQTGMLLGWLRAGVPGALAAWVAFTLPSALVMALLAMSHVQFSTATGAPHGLLLVAVGVVASAIIGMRPALAPDPVRIIIAIGAAAAALWSQAAPVAPVAIAAAATGGVLLLRDGVATSVPRLDLGISKRTGIIVLAAFSFALVALTALAVSGNRLAILANLVFRTGSLVFGGGHVVLPLLQRALAGAGIVSQSDILGGYAAAQAMPGPLFTIAAFAGARADGGSYGWLGALTATVAIFAPSFFLLAGVAPFYRSLASNLWFRRALAGANAGVLGLLCAAFVSPVFVSAIHTVADGGIALGAFVAITYFRVPAWAVVLAGAFAAYLLRM